MEKYQMNERSLGQLQHAKEEIENELQLINEAIAHKEYSEPYEFTFKPVLTSKDFSHPTVKELVEACNAAQVHMHPDVVTQLIETECFERMKGHVKRHLDGKAISVLMGMKNDIERKMLKDQLESRTERHKVVSDELDKFEEMVKSYEPPKSEGAAHISSGEPEVKPSKKKK